MKYLLIAIMMFGSINLMAQAPKEYKPLPDSLYRNQVYLRMKNAGKQLKQSSNCTLFGLGFMAVGSGILIFTEGKGDGSSVGGLFMGAGGLFTLVGVIKIGRAGSEMTKRYY